MNARFPAVIPLAILLLAGPAHAEDRETWEGTWTRTRGGEPVAEEQAKQVRTERAHYLSGRVGPAGEKGPKLRTHAQQEVDGALHKYWRKKDVRKGAELRAFRKGDVVRIVGINLKREPKELPEAWTRAIWDPRAWHVVATWTHRLRGDEGTVRALPWLDLEAASTGTATATRRPDRRVEREDGDVHPVRAWQVDGLAGGLTVYVDTAGRLAGLTSGDEEMLRTGWSWAPEVEPPPEVEAPEPPPDRPTGVPSDGAEEPSGDEAAEDAEDEAGEDAEEEPDPEEPAGSPPPRPPRPGDEGGA